MRRFAKHFIAFTVTALLSTAIATPAYAADAILPASTAAGLLPRNEISIEGIAQRPWAQNHAWKHRWAVSLAPLVASQVLDTSSSYRKRELNPLLASPNGAFGMKATSIKFASIGGLVAVEYLLVKKYPGSAKLFSILNWTTSGITTSLAVHNYGIH